MPALDIFVWALALWAGSGLIGALLIGLYLAISRPSRLDRPASSRGLASGRRRPGGLT